MDIDGRLQVGVEIKRWVKRCSNNVEGEESPAARLCFEVDAPSALSFRIVLENGWEHQTFPGAHYQATFDAWDSGEDTQYRQIAPDQADVN